MAAKSAASSVAPKASAPAIPHFPAGTPLSVTVVKKPSSEKARKTVVQILCRDPKVKKAVQKEQNARPSLYKTKTRGGRPWSKLPIKLVRFKGVVGDTSVIRADLAALAMLQSVARFVEVKKA